ncbi:MAG TPA: SBBP repeat-containing protein, partial [Verrucomicrobiae bacterium]|nr:SBBP repeat-containing protein [Verrucomicrobiae bacterium]
ADSDGNAYVTGSTGSPGFPGTPVSGLAFGRGSFVTKVSPTGDHLVFSTLLPGAYTTAIAVDGARNIYVAGYTYGMDSLITNAFQATAPGNLDAFVAKLSPDGSRLLYCTYLGGTELDLATGIAVDQAGNAFVSGWTCSTNLPVTPGALQSSLAGGFDAFVARLDPDGQRRFITYLGGSGSETGSSIALDSSGNAYLTGSTTSTNFPAAPNWRWLGKSGITLSGQKAYVAKLAGDGSIFQYLSLLGGSDSDSGVSVAVDAQGSAFVLGQTTSDNFPVTANCLQPVRRGDAGTPDNFIAKLTPAGDGLAYSTFLGGSQNEDLDNLGFDLIYVQNFHLDGQARPDTYLRPQRAGLAVDNQGNAYVGSRTASNDISPADQPGTINIGGFSGYVAKLSPDASALLWFEYLGGAQGSAITAVALASDTLVVAGGAYFTPALPQMAVTPGAFQTAYGGNTADAFVARLTAPPATPFNDNFAQRIPLSGKYLSVVADNSGATTEAGEPPALAGFGRSVWWSWKAPANGRLLATTRGTGFPSFLAVFGGDNLASLQLLATNNIPSPGSDTPGAVVPVIAGTTYQIAATSLPGQTGNIFASLVFSSATNDNFAQRVVLAGFPVSAQGSNIDASRELNERIGGGGRHSVWWEWTSPLDGTISINTFGSDFDTSLDVFDQSPFTADPVAFGDNTDTALTSQVSVTVQKGSTYYIAVDGAYEDTGHITLNIAPGVPPENDSFTNATVLSGLTTTASGSNVNATSEPGEPFFPAQFPNPANHTIWWQWTAPQDGYALVNVTAKDSNFLPRLFAYTGENLTNLALVAGNDNWTLFTRRIYFPVNAGANYHFQVDGSFFNPAGAIDLILRFTRPSQIDTQSIALQSNGALQFKVIAPSGTTPQIQSSTNLIDWQAALGTLSPGGLFTESAPGGAQPRFFRAVTAE